MDPFFLLSVNDTLYSFFLACSSAGDEGNAPLEHRKCQFNEMYIWPLTPKEPFNTLAQPCVNNV